MFINNLYRSIEYLIIFLARRIVRISSTQGCLLIGLFSPEDAPLCHLLDHSSRFWCRSCWRPLFQGILFGFRSCQKLCSTRHRLRLWSFWEQNTFSGSIGKRWILFPFWCHLGWSLILCMLPLLFHKLSWKWAQCVYDCQNTYGSWLYYRVHSDISFLFSWVSLKFFQVYW